MKIASYNPYFWIHLTLNIEAAEDSEATENPRIAIHVEQITAKFQRYNIQIFCLCHGIFDGKEADNKQWTR